MTFLICLKLNPVISPLILLMCSFMRSRRLWKQLSNIFLKIKIFVLVLSLTIVCLQVLKPIRSGLTRYSRICFPMHLSLRKKEKLSSGYMKQIIIGGNTILILKKPGRSWRLRSRIRELVSLKTNRALYSKHFNRQKDQQAVNMAAPAWVFLSAVDLLICWAALLNCKAKQVLEASLPCFFL